MTPKPLYDVEFEIRPDYNVTDSGLATMADVRSLQNVVDDGLTGDDKTIVVMDSGIDETHPVFDGVAIEHVDIVGNTDDAPDQVGHGTAVGGTIVQLAPDVDLISLRIFGDSGRTDGQTIFDAYNWLLDNAERYDLVNMSWGSGERVARIDEQHNALVDKDVYAVVAAGNTGGRGGSPATADDAFSVGAVDADGTLTRFSSYNPRRDNPDVVGVGKNNRLPRARGTSMGTPLGEDWTKASGTSFAAPIVSAFAARVLGKYDEFPLSEQFEEYARDVEGTPEDGAGIADYGATVGPDQPVDPEPDVPTATGHAWNFAGHDTLYIGQNWLRTGKSTVRKVADDGDRVVLEIEQQKQ